MNNNRGLIIVVLVATMMVLCSPAVTVMTLHPDNMTMVDEIDSCEGYAKMHAFALDVSRCSINDAGRTIVGDDYATRDIRDKTNDGIEVFSNEFLTPALYNDAIEIADKVEMSDFGVDIWVEKVTGKGPLECVSVLEFAEVSMLENRMVTEYLSYNTFSADRIVLNYGAGFDDAAYLIITDVAEMKVVAHLQEPVDEEAVSRARNCVSMTDAFVLDINFITYSTEMVKFVELPFHRAMPGDNIDLVTVGY